jgi:phosphoribosylamine--glycine ligase
LVIAGPNRETAQLESSKVFAKDFMARHGVPTARYRVASSLEEARSILLSGKFGDEDTSVVIKADGLAGGKGVVVAKSRSEALAAVDDLMHGQLIASEATNRIVLEEALTGPEASLLLFSDGRDYALMPAARDHKRIGEGDTGPNTGGMGAITSAEVLDPLTLQRTISEIVEPTLAGAIADGIPFRGILFIGLMLTSDGPRVLEYNVRFGDPEAQAILARFESDMYDTFNAVAQGSLGSAKIKWLDQSSACVVLATRGYPSQPETGAIISGIEVADQIELVEVFHAGTSRDAKGRWITAGGRVLGVTAVGETLDLALDRCYGAVDKISWDGMYYRRDIGTFKTS